MSNIAISFEHVSKMYQLGVVGTGTLSNDIKRWWAMSVLGKEDPFLKIGQTNDRATKGSSDFVYALKDIDFKVEQGDVVGIIGKNGAGKSTLLKLLSRITAPTTGTIRANGRIASLLEVGTGFHDELTGRENIYMNGTIMGMKRHEIDRKLDEIVDFAGVERYLDTPVKRYSSGMTVRLGFAVAAFLEPEILVVDEVLAVGDAEFQKKAIGKMNDVATNSGRTVLFVSHNMNSVRQLCKSGIVLKNGMVEMIGTADECVDFYVNTSVDDYYSYSKIEDRKHRYAIETKEVEFLEINMLNDVVNMSTDEPLRFRFVVRHNTPSYKKVSFGIFINNSADERLGTFYSDVIELPENQEVLTVDLEVKDTQLPRGSYYIDAIAGRYDYQAMPLYADVVHKVASFKIEYVDAAKTSKFSFWNVKQGKLLFRNGVVRIC